MFQQQNVAQEEGSRAKRMPGDDGRDFFFVSNCYVKSNSLAQEGKQGHICNEMKRFVFFVQKLGQLGWLNQSETKET